MPIDWVAAHELLQETIAAERTSAMIVTTLVGLFLLAGLVGGVWNLVRSKTWKARLRIIPLGLAILVGGLVFGGSAAQTFFGRPFAVSGALQTLEDGGHGSRWAVLDDGQEARALSRDGLGEELPNRERQHRFQLTNEVNAVLTDRVPAGAELTLLCTGYGTCGGVIVGGELRP